MHIPVTTSCPREPGPSSAPELGSLCLGASLEQLGLLSARPWSSEVCSFVLSHFIVLGVGNAMKFLCVCWEREDLAGKVGMAEPERWGRRWGELGVWGGTGGGNWLNNLIIVGWSVLL